MTQEMPEITLRRWAKTDGRPFDEPVFVFDGDALPEDLTRASVVLPAAGLDRARELLARNADQVLVGEAALLDSSLVERLSQEFGVDRVGVWVPVQRQAVSWALDTYSNADFRCVTPSVVKPAWEVLRCDGSSSGTHAGWWLGQMFERGASMAMFGVDMADDADLNLCAELMEAWGSRVWLTPLANREPDLLPWIRFGQAHHLAIPDSERYDEAAILALRKAREPATEEAL